MTTIPTPSGIAERVLGWTAAGVSTVADSDNATSRAIAAHMTLAIVGPAPSGSSSLNPGVDLEVATAAYLEQQMQSADAAAGWRAERNKKITDFRQYRHLEDVRQIVRNDSTGTLKEVIGGDYVIAPDVVVWRGAGSVPVLHAAVACKWTIRSDRVQNIRHEAVILLRHRRGHTPHIVVVTPEPLPSRLASIARGTGEVDCTYHIALDALTAAVTAYGSLEQRTTLAELLAHRRLADISALAAALLS